MAHQLKWEQADRIDLHNADIVIMTTSCPSGWAGWREYEWMGKRYRVSGRNVVHLLEAVGVRGPGYYTNHQGERQGPPPLLIESEVPTVGPRHCSPDWGGGHEILELEAAEDGDRLHIRTRCVWRSEDETHEYRQRVTYRGSYTVWWAEDLAGD